MVIDLYIENNTCYHKNHHFQYINVTLLIWEHQCQLGRGERLTELTLYWHGVQTYKT